MTTSHSGPDAFPTLSRRRARITFGDDTGAATAEYAIATMAAVAERIRRRIGWTGREDDGPFLDGYYAALRDRLERRLLFGHRRTDKFDRS